MHKSSKELELRPDPTTGCGVSCPLVSEKKIPIYLSWEKWFCHFFTAVFDQIFILAGNNDIHKSLNEFEIRPDPIHFVFVGIVDMHNI